MNLGTKLRSALQSEDVLQSVALEAFRALPGFEYRGDGSLRRFLHRLVLNKIRDRADTFNAKKRKGSVPLTDELGAVLADSAAEPTYHDSGTFERLERCLGRMSDEQRQVLLLRKVEGMSSKETAEHMGKSDDATRKLYTRALAKLTIMMGTDDTVDS
jgi:RNA polymerase sigma-70 factor (ECF subfamily)